MAYDFGGTDPDLSLISDLFRSGCSSPNQSDLKAVTKFAVSSCHGARVQDWVWVGSSSDHTAHSCRLRLGRIISRFRGNRSGQGKRRGLLAVVVLFCLALTACTGIAQSTPASNLPLNSNSANGTAIPLPMETPQANNKVPVYWLGAANKGFLYREFLRLESGDDPIRAALQLMTSSKPLDQQYTTPWSKASKIAASVSGRTAITVDISADAFTGKVDNSTAQLAVQQLVYTATAAASNAGLVDSGQGVQVTVLVDGHTDFNAFDQVKLDRPLTRDASVQAPIWIVDPQQSAVFESNSVNISGRASLNSGSLQWELYRVDAGGIPSLAQKGSTSSAAAAQAGTFAFSLDLPSGKYRLKVFGTDSASPTEQEFLEDKTFTVK